MSGGDTDLILRLRNVTVDIPLRGVKRVAVNSDPRIFTRRGRVFLRALDDITLDVRRGERVGIVGGNGNGKTTLLKLIAGVLPCSGGTAEVYGSVRSLLSITAGTALSLSGRQNVRLRYSLLGLSKISLADYECSVMEFADLGTFFDLPVGTYSPGMQSRLQFAMSTVEPAEILLLDEWMGVADRDFQQKAHDRLVQYIKDNEAFLFASHNESLLEEMTDRKIFLNMGKITTKY